MKTIKFRIFDPVKKQMRESGATPMMLSSFFENSATLDTVHKMKYQQFTGLLDKNGVGIYEGDVVTRGRNLGGQEQEHHIVIFDYDFLSFLDRTPENIIEVIGNIYENPELIK